MTSIPFALAAVKGRVRWRGLIPSPLAVASLRKQAAYVMGGVGLPRL